MRVLRIAGCAIALTALAVGCNEVPTAVDDGESALFKRKKGNPGSDEGVTWLTNGRGVQDRWPSYSHDGNTIVFSRLPRGGNQYDLYTVSAAGGEATLLLSLEGKTAYGSKWSPSGEWIAFSVEDYDDANSKWVSDVWVIKPNGDDAHALNRTGLSDYVSWPSWYPAEDYLAVNDYTGDTIYRPLMRISCCDAASSAAVPLTDSVQAISAGWSSVYPSGSGVDVAFAGQAPGGEGPLWADQRLWIVHDDLIDNPPADASLVPNMTNMTGQAPGWSPPYGEWLAFQSRPNTPETDWWNIWIVKPDGTGLLQVTDPFWVKDALYPAWHPDGTHLVFSARKNPFKPDRWLAVMKSPLP